MVYNESHRHIVSLPGFQSVFLFARLPFCRSIYARTSVSFSSQLALTVVISCNCHRDVLNSQCGILIFFSTAISFESVQSFIEGGDEPIPKLPDRLVGVKR